VLCPDPKFVLQLKLNFCVGLLQLFCEVKTLSTFKQSSLLSNDNGNILVKQHAESRILEGPNPDTGTILFGHKTVSVIK
jgi:hypothetical protein